MSDTPQPQESLQISTALCVGRAAYDRLGRVLRHLVVGLVDQAVHLRLVGDDPRVESLALGPIQTVVHGDLTWPMANRRTQRLIEALGSPRPPTTIHALSAESYHVAAALAGTFDADLILQVTSLADCEAVVVVGTGRVSRFLVFSEPLAAVLQSQLKVPPAHVALVRPGTRTAKTSACFCDEKRVPTILCTSAFERGSGLEQLLEAVKMLREKQCQFFLFLLGEGRQEAALRRLVRDHKLSSCVTFAHPLGDLTLAMQSADIFVRTREDTAFSVDGLLAMAAGMIIVTFPNSISDYARGGETAVVCDERSADSLAAALERVLADREEAKRLADAGREYVRTAYAISEMAERTTGVYRELALGRATFPIKE